ncbi:MAG: LptA/OstA family protein [Beijerinckiaceae bacterium]
MTFSARRSVAAIAAVLIAAAMFAQPAAFAQRSGSPVLPGGNAREPIQIDAAKLEYFDKEQRLVYSGGVTAKQGDSTLKAATLTIFFTRDEDGKGKGAKPANGAGALGGDDNQVRRMEASGPVTITNRTQVGTGDRGVYDRVENKVYLIGNPVLTEGPHVVRGNAQSQLIYDLTSGRAQISGGRVQSLITPGQGNAGGDKPKPRQ